MIVLRFIKSIIRIPLDAVMCILGLAFLAILVLAEDIDWRLDSMMWKRRMKKKEMGTGNNGES